MKNIRFYTMSQYYGAIPEPVPASQMPPDWFKAMAARIDETRTLTKSNITMKMCAGISDAFGYGYIMPAWCDFRIWWEHGMIRCETAWAEKFISFFTPEQSKGFPFPDGHHNTMVKITLPWRVETDPGTSILVTYPKWHDNKFSVYEGIVDSDVYVNSIHAVLTFKPGEPIVIKRGQPLIQIVPLIREDWSSEILEWTPDKELDFQRQQNATNSYMVAGYKQHFWNAKKF